MLELFDPAGEYPGFFPQLVDLGPQGGGHLSQRLFIGLARPGDLVAAPALAEVRLALAGRDGRKVVAA